MLYGPEKHRPRQWVLLRQLTFSANPGNVAIAKG